MAEVMMEIEGREVLLGEVPDDTPLIEIKWGRYTLGLIEGFFRKLFNKRKR